jgi:spore germination protein YaaH
VRIVRYVQERPRPYKRRIPPECGVSYSIRGRIQKVGKFKLIKVMALWGSVIGLVFSATQGVAAADEKKFNMSYLYFGNSNAYTGIVDKTGNSLDAIAPSYFDLNDNGSLKLTQALDTGFIRDMHNRGVQVTPFLSNHWDRQKGIKALANREALSSQIAKAVSDYNLDGVDVDIENLTPAERNSYVDFMRLLRQKLPAGKSLSIAVAPNPWNLTTGWNASYDFAALAQYVDYLMLMTYDEHYQGGPEGPVASGPFVEDSIKAALGKVSPDKLVLGIAFYGRLWKQGSNYGGYGISNNTVEELISKYRGVVTYDSVARSPKAVITINAGDVKPVVFGQQLEAGKYDIWYENEQSIKDKLQLVQKYDLKGTGSWSLGQEAQSTWDYYRLWLDGMYFKDVQGYWAQESIMKVVDLGWMVGVPGSLFQPDASLTRAQAAVALVRALGLADNAAGAAAETAFSDTAGHWARRGIEIARQYNIVAGTGNGRFSPDLPITREQMAVMLDRVLFRNGGSASDQSMFEDVSRSASSWSYDSIIRMAENGIITGYPDGLFHPAERITRAQLAVLMDRSAPRISDGIILASLS